MSNEATATQEAPAPAATAVATPAGANPAVGDPTPGAVPAPNESAPSAGMPSESATPATGSPNESTAAAAAAAAAESADTRSASTSAAASGVEVRLADLPQADPNTVAAPGGQVDILLDTMMPVSASLGQVTMPIRDLIQLGQGSVVKLDRQVGAPIDLFLRGIQFATGHLVVVGERLGVRIQEILPVNPVQGPSGEA
jgi:flagellar motor switch protein FliN/FliY